MVLPGELTIEDDRPKNRRNFDAGGRSGDNDEDQASCL